MATSEVEKILTLTAHMKNKSGENGLARLDGKSRINTFKWFDLALSLNP